MVSQTYLAIFKSYKVIFIALTLLLFLLPFPVIMHAQEFPTVFIPHFSGTIPFEQTGIFWFGQVTSTLNYADVRVGYNDQELYLYFAVFDRRLWHDQTPTAAELTQWDALRLYIDTAPESDLLDSSTYRFTAQFNGGGAQTSYQESARGDGTGFSVIPIQFTTLPGWRGDAINNAGDGRGWAMAYRVPFASLNLPAPAADTLWRAGVELFDRDDQSGTGIPVTVWPNGFAALDPATWGNITFSLPVYQPPTTSQDQTVIIRHKLNSVVSSDASVGGGSVCGDGLDFWSEWGNKNYTNDPNILIRIQSDVADWPCFSKIYLTFPINLVPPGKVIKSASLTLHQFGNAGGTGEAQDSWVQVSEAASNWNESIISWNNAPQSQNNASYSWVAPIITFPGWPGVARTWDISWLLNKNYQAQLPLQLVMYSVDSAYHSGKYFVSADTGDWNETGRPTLTVTYGDPVITADLDHNQKVNIFDAALLFINFGTSQFDLTGDGIVDTSDLKYLILNWSVF